MVAEAILINFHVRVNFANEKAGANIANGATNDAQCATEQCHVTKIERCLKQSIHFCFEKEIIKWIHINVNGGGGGWQKTSPLPSVVLGIQQEICAHNCHTYGHNDHDDGDQQHESVDVVDFVGPERGENKVHLDEYGAEG